MTSERGNSENRTRQTNGAGATATAKTSSSDPASEYRRQLAEHCANAERLSAQARFKHLVDTSGIPTRHIAVVAAEKPCVPWEAARARLFAMLGTGFLLVIHGPRGCGKTQLAVSAIVERCKAFKPCRYIRAMDLFRTLRDSLGSREEVLTFQRFANTSLLVIDEIQDRGDTQFEDAALANLVDHRYGERRDTILISTATPDDLSNSLPTSIISRVHETGGTIACNWPSFRSKRCG